MMKRWAILLAGATAGAVMLVLLLANKLNEPRLPPGDKDDTSLSRGVKHAPVLPDISAATQHEKPTQQAPEVRGIDDVTHFGCPEPPLVRVVLPQGAPSDLPQVQLNFLRETANGLRVPCWVGIVTIDVPERGRTWAVMGTSLRLAVGTGETLRELGDVWASRMFQIALIYRVRPQGEVSETIMENGQKVERTYKVEGQLRCPEFEVPAVKRGEIKEIDLVIAGPQQPATAAGKAIAGVVISGRVAGIPKEELVAKPPRWVACYFRADSNNCDSAALDQNGEFSIKSKELGGELVVIDASHQRAVIYVRKVEKLPLTLPKGGQWIFRPDTAIKLEVNYDWDKLHDEGAKAICFLLSEKSRAFIACIPLVVRTRCARPHNGSAARQGRSSELIARTRFHKRAAQPTRLTARRPPPQRL